MFLKNRSGLRAVVVTGLLLVSLVVLVACGNDDADDGQILDEQATNPGPDLDAIDRVDELVELLNEHDRDDLRSHAFEIEAWVLAPPQSPNSSGTPPQGCPVVPDKQDWLSDDPLTTRLEIAGAVLPNDQLAESAQILRLVVPYQLGFIDIPDRARLRGHVLNESYSGCPSAETLFVLEEVLDELPAGTTDEQAEPVTEWEKVTSEHGQVEIEYPAGWELEERESGPSSRIRFLGPEPFRTIRFEVQEGETWWHPDSDGGNPPDILGGDHREPATAGQVYARLVDDRRRSSVDEREIRLVFNHQGQTIIMAMMMRDGVEPDLDSAWIFSEMASRMHLMGDVGMSDPMDPILASSDELGEGPFLSEADARYVALQASGLTMAETTDAELVTERTARAAVDGACRNFDGRPAGIWLVTVDGVSPSGSETQRLVYLDASNGLRLCQAEAPGFS
jgi:hypothetical protein